MTKYKGSIGDIKLSKVLTTSANKIAWIYKKQRHACTTFPCLKCNPDYFKPRKPITIEDVKRIGDLFYKKKGERL